jgi:hypothetical protein
VILAAIQTFLSCSLVVAGISKLLYGETFGEALHLTRIPASLVKPAAYVVIACELILASLVLVARGSLLRASFLGVAALLAAFTIWMALVMVSGSRPKCGCFGSSSGEVGFRSIARNLAFLSAAVAGAVLSRASAASALPHPSAGLALVALPIVGAIAVSIAVLDSFRHLVLTRRRLDEVISAKELREVT